MAERTPVLEAHGLRLRYGTRVVFDDLSFVAATGCWTALVGANGSGKSTLLRALAGLMAPARGEVRLGARPVGAWPRRERARMLGWLAQGAAWPEHLTARACVTLGRFAWTGWLGAPSPADQRAVESAMALAGVAALADRRMSTLSGGERQRVLLARALATGSPVLLLDEPTTFLDPPHQEEVARLLRHLARERGVTVVAAMHDLSLALAADRIAVLRPGGLVGNGTIDEAIAGNWLGQAFGGRIAIEVAGGARLWRPDLGGAP